MTRISRAPVLSATRRRVSFWIIGPASLRPLDDPNQPPALGPRERTRLAHDHRVADVRVVRLVVGVQRVRGADDLLVAAVAPSRVGPPGDLLIGLVRHHDALTRLLATRPVLARKLVLGHRAGNGGASLLARAGPLDSPSLRLALALGEPLGVALLGRQRLARLGLRGLGRAGAAPALLGRDDLRRLARSGRLGGCRRLGRGLLSLGLRRGGCLFGLVVLSFSHYRPARSVLVRAGW